MAVECDEDDPDAVGAPEESPPPAPRLTKMLHLSDDTPPSIKRSRPINN